MFALVIPLIAIAVVAVMIALWLLLVVLAGVVKAAEWIWDLCIAYDRRRPPKPVVKTPARTTASPGYEPKWTIHRRWSVLTDHKQWQEDFDMLLSMSSALPGRGSTRK